MGVDEMILDWILKKNRMYSSKLYPCGSVQGPVWHGNDPSQSIEGREILD
jgi:hypothetical protein